MLSAASIRLKIISCMFLVSALALGSTIYLTANTYDTDRGYNDFLAHESVAAVLNSRSTTNLMQLALQLRIAFEEPLGSKRFQAAEQAIEKNKKNIIDRQTKAAELAPIRAQAASELIAQAKSMIAEVDRGMGAIRAGQREAAADAVKAVSDKAVELLPKFTAGNDELGAVIEQGVIDLHGKTVSSISYALLFLAAATVLAIGFTMVVTTRGICRPLESLRKNMIAIAGGSTDVEIDGRTRRDEIGSMANAVQVFKDAAIEQRRLEAEAVATREAQAASRARQTSIDNAKAEDLRVLVHAVEAAFDRLSCGDLTVRMDGGVAPEFEPIRAKFNDAVAQLEDTVGSVVGAVGTMRVGLKEITVAAGDLSQRTEQQAANLEETVAALSEVVRGVDQTAQHADDARAAASLAQMEAEKGGNVVSQAVAAMSEIEQSSNKIGSIIGVIDEIAFQTNLLALNAGVEAARAGEAGRGFAVVAQEVRGLAQRSAEAARDIKDLISTSRQQVASGVELVSASGCSLGEILTQVGGVTEVIAEIARSAREQAASLKEVSVAADQMDKVTQQNAAMVEETTAAAQSLSAETEQLAGLIDGFRTSAAGRSASNASTAKASAPAFAQNRGARFVPQLRTTGRGGAAQRPETVQDNWEEF